MDIENAIKKSLKETFKKHKPQKEVNDYADKFLEESNGPKLSNPESKDCIESDDPVLKRINEFC